jgi:xeroderma pigmentosum group C-complementing protein
MRSGRVVRAGCQPMKLVKMRAATVGKLREIELAEEMRRGAEKAGGASGEQEEVMQGMYAESQTELYVPEPIIDVCFSLIPALHPIFGVVCS